MQIVCVAKYQQVIAKLSRLLKDGEHTQPCIFHRRSELNGKALLFFTLPQRTTTLRRCAALSYKRYFSLFVSSVCIHYP